MKIVLSWPDKKLSPNARLHWAQKSKAVKKAKSDAYYLAKSLPMPQFGAGNIPVSVVFHPPSRRRFDLDNALARLKSAFDGLCLAWGIDDVRLRPISLDVGEVRKGGAVEIEI